jgi:hypothetical protein
MPTCTDSRPNNEQTTSTVSSNEPSGRKKSIEDRIGLVTLPKDGFLRIARQPFLESQSGDKDDSDKAANGVVNAISRSLKNGFNLQYDKTSDSLKTTRSSAEVPQQSRPEIPSYQIHFGQTSLHRCLVESFISLPVGTKVLLLVPEHSMHDSFHEVAQLQQSREVIILNKTAFVQLRGNVKANPNVSTILSGMDRRDVINGFGVGRRGLAIQLDNYNSTIEISWGDILAGDGIQVWCHHNPVRDFYGYFKNYRSMSTRKKLLVQLQKETLGDSFLTLLLVAEFRRAGHHWKTINESKVAENSNLLQSNLTP